MKHIFKRAASALAGGLIAITLSGAPAQAGTGDTLFSCFSSYISAESPGVTPTYGGFSNELVTWQPEYLRYVGGQWVTAGYGKTAYKSLYGAGGAMSWYFLDGSGVADVQYQFGLPAGYYAVRNTVYHWDTGELEYSWGHNAQYRMHPEHGGDEYWCSSY